MSPDSQIPSPSSRVAQGRAAESVAACFLELLGYQIIERNRRQGPLEIDLIARDGLTLCFVEVRLRRVSRFGEAVDSIDRPKQRRLRRAAAGYLAAHPVARARFDVIAIDWSPQTGMRLRHVRDAFR